MNRRIVTLSLVALALVSGRESASAQVFTMDNMPETVCSGTFTDSGGLAGDYGQGELFVKTFTPATPGARLRFDFSSFDVAGGHLSCYVDFLTVYDGPSAGSPRLGSFCSARPAETIISSAPGGALTFVFESDLFVEGGGWEATISCVSDPLDDCAGALPLRQWTNRRARDQVFLGTPSDGVPACDCASTPGTVRWYSYTSSISGTLVLDTRFSETENVLSAYDACGGTQIQCAAENAQGTGSFITFRMGANETVLIRVAAFCDPGAIGTFEIGYVFYEHDLCSNARDFQLGAVSPFLETLFMPLAGTPGEGDASCDCPNGTSTDTYYRYTAVTSGQVTVRNQGASSTTFGVGPFADPRVSIHSGCPATPANELACLDLATETTFGVVEGDSFIVRAYDLCRSSSVARIHVQLAVPPIENDDCENAIALDPGYQVVEYNTAMLSTSTDGASAAGFCDYGPASDMNFNDIWYTWIPTETTCVYISTYGLAFSDTRLTIYQGYSCPDDPANIIACVDDEVSPDMSPYEAGLDLNVVAGELYTIRLGTHAASVNLTSGSLRIAPGPHAEPNSQGGNPGALGCTPPTFAESCNGDGGDQLGCTECPCMNEMPAGTPGGCMNSAGTATRLVSFGGTSVSIGDLRFEATGAPPSNSAVLTSGNALAPANASNPCFGQNSGVPAMQLDGLRCVVQGVLRHGVRQSDSNGEIGNTTNGWGTPSGFFNFSAFVAGSTKHFQIIHRDDTGAVCMRGQNTSQAVSVLFTM